MAKAARVEATPTRDRRVLECQSRSSHGSELDPDGIVQANVVNLTTSLRQATTPEVSNNDVAGWRVRP
jgi:hypothetical protein